MNAKTNNFGQLSADPARQSLEEDIVLVCADEFQELGLRLYNMYFQVDDGPLQDGWMIGDGKELFLGAMLSEGEDMFFTGGNEVPIMNYPMKGKLQPLPIEIKYALNLEKRNSLRLGAADKARCADGWRQIPPELHAEMAAACLIKPVSGSYLWELTPVGLQYGLIQGFLLLDERRTCHTFFAPENVLDALKALLTESRPDQDAQKSGRAMSLEERLDRMAMGLPGNDAYAVELLKRLGDMPLEQYMGHCPDKLEQLQKELPGGPAGTVREAAARICEVWNTSGYSMKPCENLIWLLLVEPMVDGMRKFQNLVKGEA